MATTAPVWGNLPRERGVLIKGVFCSYDTKCRECGKTCGLHDGTYLGCSWQRVNRTYFSPQYPAAIALPDGL